MKPAFCKRHRIYFPERDFKKLKQLARKGTTTRPVIGDLTISDDESVVWKRQNLDSKMPESEMPVSVIYSDEEWSHV